jgi:hypothetical protein
VLTLRESALMAVKIARQKLPGAAAQAIPAERARNKFPVISGTSPHVIRGTQLATSVSATGLRAA